MIKQGYRGSLTLGTTTGTRMPCLPGSTLSMPKNIQLPPVAHNMPFQVLWVEGLQVPVLNVAAVVTPSWFTAINLNAWLITRLNDDLAAIAGTDDYAAWFCDGSTEAKVKFPKGNTFVIGSTQGQPITTNMMFMGTEIDEVTPVDDFTVITEMPLNWSAVEFDAGAAPWDSEVVAWQLMFTNNAAPNPVHNESVHPSEINAGPFIATLRLTLNEQVARPVDGTAFFIYVHKGASVVGFEVRNPVCQAPWERAIVMGRTLRQYDYLLLGDATGPTENDQRPIEITEP